MKAILSFLVGFIIGAVFIYGYLWYQVYQKAEAVWCQIYTGQMSVEMVEKCRPQ